MIGGYPIVGTIHISGQFITTEIPPGFPVTLNGGGEKKRESPSQNFDVLFVFHSFFEASGGQTILAFFFSNS